MKKKFKVKNLSPFDLLRWDKDTFYNYLNEEYHRQTNLWIEILEANTTFCGSGLCIEIITFRED